MIFDQFGKPTRKDRVLETPEWVKRDTIQSLRDWDAERRLRELRNSIVLAESLTTEGWKVGETIRVRVPKRFEP